MNIRLAARALVLAVFAGCSVSPATPPTGSPASGASASSASPSIPPASPWDDEVGHVGPDGTRSLESALKLMAMAFGPIPGIDAATAAPGTVGSASPAVRAVRAMLDELTPEQREAVDRYLAPSRDAKTLEVPPVGGMAPLGGLLAVIPPVTAEADHPYSDFGPEVLADAAKARAQAAKYFGDMPGLRVRFDSFESEPWLTFFIPIAGPAGVQSCDVIVNGAHNNDRFAIRRSLTLDIVHCLQSGVLGSEAGFFKQVPAWAWEGPAEYINLEQWPPQPSDAVEWFRYFETPALPLFERAYDAVGYYAQASAAGVDLGLAFKAVLTDADQPTRFALAGTDTDGFLDTWASRLARISAWPRTWWFDGPGIAGITNSPERMQATAIPITVSNGSNEAFSADPYTNGLYVLISGADIVLVEATGHARIGDGSFDAVLPGTGAFCTTDKGCGPCPDGQKPPIERTRLVPDALLAVSGGTKGTTGFVSGHPLEEFCKATPKVCESGGAPAAAADLPTLGMVLVSRAITAAADCPTPSPSDDGEFCKRWRDYRAWAVSVGDVPMTRELAREIVKRFEAMEPVAPAKMVPPVRIVALTYRAFADAPDDPNLPIQVPLTGQSASDMYKSLLAIDGYCGTKFFPKS